MVLQSLLLLGIAVNSPCEPYAFTGPEPGEIVVLASATGRSVPVQHPVGAEYHQFANVDVVAHEFVVNRATPPNLREMGRWGMLAPADTFLVVPWRYDSACKRLPWGESTWVPAGQQVVFRVLSARRHEGIPVIDVSGLDWPYPYGQFLSQELGPGAPSDPAMWLPANDFFTMLWRAPRNDSPETRTKQLEIYESYYRSGPTYLMERYPGPQLLEHVRGWAAGYD
jgi:hypothetical protein